MPRGYCGIGIYNPLHSMNVGTLWRSAMAFDVDFLFVIGLPIKAQPSDTTKATRHIPLWHFPSWDHFLVCRPSGTIMAVEITPEAQSLPSFAHPERAIYVLGNERHGLPEEIITRCHTTIRIPSRYCLNVAVAGSIVLYDRARFFPTTAIA